MLACTFILLSLSRRTIFLADSGLDADLQIQFLLDLVAADLLHIATLDQNAHVDAALGEFSESARHRPGSSLKSSSANSGEQLFALLDARIRALEVEAVGDFLVGLIHRVAQFDHVDFGDDVE
jgi:hypothetical protein